MNVVDLFSTAPSFEFERLNYSTPENNGSVEVCVVTASERERDVIVRVETLNTGTATGEFSIQYIKIIVYIKICISNIYFIQFFVV